MNRIIVACCMILLLNGCDHRAEDAGGPAALSIESRRFYPDVKVELIPVDPMGPQARVETTQRLEVPPTALLKLELIYRSAVPPAPFYDGPMPRPFLNWFERNPTTNIICDFPSHPKPETEYVTRR